MDPLIKNLFDCWVSQLNIEGGASVISLDHAGMAALEIDRGLVVNFQAQSSPPVLTLYVLVGALPPANRAALMQDMLEANLLWSGTAGATLSLQRAPRDGALEVVAAQAIPVHKGTATKELGSVFNNICLVALDWQARLENSGQWLGQADMDTSHSVNPDWLP